MFTSQLNSYLAGILKLHFQLYDLHIKEKSENQIFQHLRSKQRRKQNISVLNVIFMLLIKVGLSGTERLSMKEKDTPVTFASTLLLRRVILRDIKNLSMKV